jgi:hypothetical protein
LENLNGGRICTVAVNKLAQTPTPDRLYLTSQPIQDKMLSTIPFLGFYETIHDNSIDRAIESLFEDDNGDLINHFYSSNCIDYEKVRIEDEKAMSIVNNYQV